MAKSSGKSRTIFLCRECGSTHPRWAGRCPDCGVWDSLERFREPEAADHGSSLLAGAEETIAGAPDGRPFGAVPLGEVPVGDVARIATGVSELDRVLGGGVVPGSAILLGGDPGVGKSTLLLQALASMAGRLGGQAGDTAESGSVLYVSSEESAGQVRLRAERLGGADRPGLLVLSEVSLPRILEQVRRHRPAVIAVDSIQMLHRPDLPAAPGSATQLRRCCLDLVATAKRTGSVVVVVGHVTKDGQLAGPKLLEHLVDVVLSFEGDRHHAHRVIRAVKNRFGSTAEIGLLEMAAQGLAEPAAGTLALDSEAGTRPGSVVFPTVAGSRGLLAEIQALTATAIPGTARRKASGLDANRLAVMIAVLEKHGGLRLAERDVFAAATGGLRIVEPACDLAVALSIAGAHYGRVIGRGVAAFGEVGLTGEIRPVANAEARYAEARRRGIERVIVPASQKDLAAGDASIDRVRTITEALERLGPASKGSAAVETLRGEGPARSRPPRGSGTPATP
ncbi:MAG: DNA repair protein RadA [Phycisphaerales bacterium]